MPRNLKEWLIGFIPALLLFLLYMKVNIVPLLIFGGLAAGIFYFMKTRGKVGIAAEKSKRAKKPSYLTFEDIGGQERAKKELMEALDFLIRQDEIRKLGIRPLKGILLTGPPVPGKR